MGTRPSPAQPKSRRLWHDRPRLRDAMSSGGMRIAAGEAMQSHSTPRIDRDARLSQIVADANALIRYEFGPQYERLRLYWRLEKDWESGRNGLALVMMDGRACEATFRFSDMAGGMNGFRERLRLWCGRLLTGPQGDSQAGSDHQPASNST